MVYSLSYPFQQSEEDKKEISQVLGSFFHKSKQNLIENVLVSLGMVHLLEVIQQRNIIMHFKNLTY